MPAPRVLALARSTHPEPALAVTTVTAVLSMATGRSWPGVLAATATVFASQLAVGLANDALDAERDASSGRADKPVALGQVSRRSAAVAAGVAAVATVPLAFLSGWVAGLVAVLGLVSALLYDWPLKSTPLSVLPYAVSFAALPAFVVLGAGHRPPLWLVAGGALLGSGAHFANALPDLDDDARTGVRGLPHILGPVWSSVAAAAGLVGATTALAFGPPGAPSWLGWAAFGVAMVVAPTGLLLGRRRPGSRTPFRALLVIALVDVVLLLASGPETVAG